MDYFQSNILLSFSLLQHFYFFQYHRSQVVLGTIELAAEGASVWADVSEQALATFGLALFYLEDDLDFSRFWGFFLFSCHISIFQNINN
jgi:hypothetical protein